MNLLDTNDIRALDWGDAHLFGFIWENEGKDLKLFIRHASRSISAITCSWARDLRVDLNWKPQFAQEGGTKMLRGGPLLTWECSIETTENGRCKIFLDFAHDGHMTFECEEMAAIESPNEHSPMNSAPPSV